jgi:hypothetical protein
VVHFEVEFAMLCGRIGVRSTRAVAQIPE